MYDSQSMILKETSSFGPAKAPSAHHTPKFRASSVQNSLGHNTEWVLQVVGFMILVAGTSMYNELLRGCLPGVPPPVSQEDSLQVSCPTTYFLDILYHPAQHGSCTSGSGQFSNDFHER